MVVTSKLDNLRTDVTVVVRSVGERTVDLCLRLLEEQVAAKNIYLINEVPFSKAVRRTFEIGLDNNLPWTIAVDGDMLLGDNAITKLVSLAEKESEDFFRFNGRLIDKFFELPRVGGPHLYRTSLCDVALKNFPDTESIRPETAVVFAMREKNELGYRLYEDIVGLHDFEQWYRDIYRKAFVHTKKHGDFIWSFLRYWLSNIEDDDYKVAFAGLCSGLGSIGDVIIDMRTLPVNYSENALLVDIKEKPPLVTPKWKSGKEITHYINRYTYSRMHPTLDGFNNCLVDIDASKVIPRMIGYIIKIIGEKIYHWAGRGS